MASAMLEESLNVRYTFTPRPRPLPGDLRPVWRLNVLALSIHQCHSGRATLEQLHVLNWALRSQATRRLFLEYIAGHKSPDQVIVRYDPSLSRAVEFALAEGIVQRSERQETIREVREPSATQYRISLTARGRVLVDELFSLDDCLQEEKEFLKQIGKKVTQKQVQSLFTWTDQ
jgi:hypothetical protein